MPHQVRELTERREQELLSRYAAKASASAGRAQPEEPDPVRTAFQRDRDRVLHSKSFRRLSHKAQVFIDPQGDHFRTRMTHTLEVSQIARTIGRALRLNEDLIEAIALGHDVGHTPFGHAGEDALDEAVRKAAEIAPGGPTRFRHYEQSLRIVDVLERLNLTEETRQGIGGHSKGRADLSSHDGMPTSTLEAAVVRISDRIAYLNHDLDDALRARIIKDIPAFAVQIAPSNSQRIGAMVSDAIANSLDKPGIELSKSMMTALNDLKDWLYENVYNRYPALSPDTLKAQQILRDLFAHYLKAGTLPDGYEGTQGAIDYVAGMTDRFAIETYAELKMPRGFATSNP